MVIPASPVPRHCALVVFALFSISCERTSQEVRLDQHDAVALNDSAVALFSKASIMHDIKGQKRAISILDRAIEIDSTYRTAVMNKASFLYTMGREDSAAALIIRWLSDNPHDDGAMETLRWIQASGTEPLPPE